jgi:arylsulfatase A-like enzyme
VPAVTTALVLALLLPPAWIALAGGADLDVFAHRLDFYDDDGPVLAVLGALASCFLVRGEAGRVARGIALLAFALAAAVSWTGGFHTEALSMRRPDRVAQIGWVAVLFALARARGSLAPVAGAGRAAVGLALGLLLLFGVRAADRADLEARMAAHDHGARTPDVVFLTLDALRADALGLYGADPSPSPFLDALGAQAVVFENALAQGAWTVPSVSSFLSSLYASSYLPEWDHDDEGRFIRLPDGLPWLPARLHEAGYHTAGFVKNPLLQPGTRFERGFDVYEYLRGDTAEHDSAAQLVDATLRWAERMAARRRGGDGGSFFLYVHFMDPHIEYRPPAAFAPPGGERYEGSFDGGVRSLNRLMQQPGGPTPADLERVRALYRAEVAYLDSELARLHAGLAQLALLSADTIVVVVADHGEQFFEHGGFKHEDAYWPNLHVPFLLRAPGLAPRRIAEVARLIDLAPTLLDLLGLDPIAPSEGRSLAGRLAAGPLGLGPVVSERAMLDGVVRVTGPRFSLIARPSETELYRGRDAVRLTDDFAHEEIDALRETLMRHRARPLQFTPPSQETAPSVDRDTRERLEALGYVE